MRYSVRIPSFLVACCSILIILASGAGAVEPESLEVSLAEADVTFLGEDGGDWAGYSVSPAGDINADGLADILVGAPYAAPGDEHGDGKVYLILGRPRDDWPADHINLSQVDISFVGLDSYPNMPDMLGRQNYAAGDVNGDGYDDFLISCWRYSDGVPPSRGRAYLFLGRPSVDWGANYPVEQADASFLGEDDMDFAGWYVSTAGDVNADGFDDLLITATGDEEGGGEQAGQVYLILGRAGADWGLDYDLGQADASFIGEAADDRAGRSATGGGDVNGDGYGDFLIGAIGNNEGGEDAGQSYLILGRAAADWGTHIPLSMADASFIGEAAGDEAGRRVAWAGDVNRDGFSDFLIGASRNDQISADAGKFYLFLGNPSADWGMDYPLAQADSSFLGEGQDDQAGRRVSGAGDLNHDGYSDFVAIAPHNTRAGENSGTAYLFYGRSEADWGHDLPAAQADIVYIAEVGNDRVYDTSAAGDMDGDGIDDLLIGAYRASESGNAAGNAYVLYGSATPVALQFTPDVPDGHVGEWHTFTGFYWDPNGWEDLTTVQVLLGRSIGDRKALNLLYRPATDGLYLRNAVVGGWLGPCTPGEPGVLSNGIVELDCGLSSVSHGDRQSLQVVWRGRWIQNIASARHLTGYLRASDRAGNNSGYQALGGWILLPEID